MKNKIIPTALTMSNNKNINIHPALSPRNYIIIPYCFSRINNVSKKEVEETDNVVSIKPIHVNSFNEIKHKVVEELNLHHTAKVTIDSIGEEDYDEGFCFGNSIAVYIETEQYNFCISFDCYATINAYQWGENARWAKI